MSTWLNRFKAGGIFLLGRYPLLNAILLMMILAERADTDGNKPPLPVYPLCCYVGAMVLLGLCMSYEFKRKEAAFGFVLQTAVFAFTIYSNQKLGYKPWLRNRLICRCFGLMGVFVIYAFLTSKEKSKRLQKMGEGLLAVFTMTYMYILVNGPEDRGMFRSKIPIPDISLYFLVTVMGACVMIYINGGLFVTDASQAMMCINLALLLASDIDVHYWNKKRGTPFWVQMKLIADDIIISIGLYVMAFAKVYWEKRLPKERKDGRFYRID